ncbi:hypothetical protein ACEWY4_024525 [Coilia grayii]|uniref:Uncharacterized protein n=1 Tax=Coilia grayii TaxID=363190 RepID=A0ABD1J0L1_9TELE
MEHAIVQGFQLDPESDPEGEAPEEVATQRVQQDVSEWCHCGNCGTMPSEAENICCLEIQIPHVVTRRLREVEGQLTCMVDHPGLEPVCLNVYSLQNARQIYRTDYCPLCLRGIHRRYRYLSYRSFVMVLVLWLLGTQNPGCYSSVRSPTHLLRVS